MGDVAEDRMGADVTGLEGGMEIGDVTSLRNVVTKLRDQLHDQVRRPDCSRTGGPLVYRTPFWDEMCVAPANPNRVLPLFVDLGNVEYKLSY